MVTTKNIIPLISIIFAWCFIIVHCNSNSKILNEKGEYGTQNTTNGVVTIVVLSFNYNFSTFPRQILHISINSRDCIHSIQNESVVTYNLIFNIYINFFSFPKGIPFISGTERLDGKIIVTGNFSNVNPKNYTLRGCKDFQAKEVESINETTIIIRTKRWPDHRFNCGLTIDNSFYYVTQHNKIDEKSNLLSVILVVCVIGVITITALVVTIVVVVKCKRSRNNKSHTRQTSKTQHYNYTTLDE
ncbi:hypothetical protein PPL_01435 [Heterostelium album PN500]|uniref:Uncharacterized protein n=1 Tax=Heterostelium pallidum (strain ATCC 26659 / Pp 5 / PN500) TaxID=670386 RepID=D3AZ95_HETP5|nr:hypothetical protein PPL_01435 [Heterostelium album PN500]EFA85478.1 hypothetical protein PPL_01435 [Heterostelium album PN500]|eukprot:XP_020437586.1 hypothetical protein PPL_01435 [Heterostelium album PN500]